MTRDVLNNLIGSLGLIAIGFVALTLLNPSIAHLSGETVPANRLGVVSVEFKNGRFHQHLEPSKGVGIQATWAAAITDGSDLVCSGSNTSTYRPGERSAWSPDDWTDDDCSTLVEGRDYHAEASWSHNLPNGGIHTVTVDFDFTYVPEVLE